MKKKILGGLLVVAIAAVTAFNVNTNTDKNELSLLSLANVEALAQAEKGTSAKICYKKSTPVWRGIFSDCAILLQIVLPFIIVQAI